MEESRNISPYAFMGIQNPKEKMDIAKQKKIESIIEEACDVMGLELDILMSKYKGCDYSNGRFIIWGILFNLLGVRQCDVTRIFGKDHATIINGIKKHNIRTSEGMKMYEHEYQSKYNQVLKRLTEKNVL